MAGYLRRQVLIALAVPLPVTGLLAVAVRGQLEAPGWTVFTGVAGAVACLLLAVVIQPAPLPRGLGAQASARRALLRLRQLTQLRLGLPVAALAIGAGAALAGGGLMPYLVALLVAWPQMLLAWPGFRVVATARRGMEVWGARAYVWAALNQPAPRIRPRPAARSAASPEPAARTPAPETPHESGGPVRFQPVLGSAAQSVFDDWWHGRARRQRRGGGTGRGHTVGGPATAPRRRSLARRLRRRTRVRP